MSIVLEIKNHRRHFQRLLKYLLSLLNPHSIISVICYFWVGHKSPTNPQASTSLRLSSPQMGSLSFKSPEGLFLWVQVVMARDHRKQEPNIVLYLKSICWIRSWSSLWTLSVDFEQGLELSGKGDIRIYWLPKGRGRHLRKMQVWGSEMHWLLLTIWYDKLSHSSMLKHKLIVTFSGIWWADFLTAII